MADEASLTIKIADDSSSRAPDDGPVRGPTSNPVSSFTPAFSTPQPAPATAQEQPFSSIDVGSRFASGAVPLDFESDVSASIDRGNQEVADELRTLTGLFTLWLGQQSAQSASKPVGTGGIAAAAGEAVGMPGGASAPVDTLGLHQPLAAPEPVEVTALAPPPVQVDAIEPHPVEAQVYGPNELTITPTQGAPLRTDVVQPPPVMPTVEQPESVRPTVQHPDLSTIAADLAQQTGEQLRRMLSGIMDEAESVLSAEQREAIGKQIMPALERGDDDSLRQSLLVLVEELRQSQRPASGGAVAPGAAPPAGSPATPGSVVNVSAPLPTGAPSAPVQVSVASPISGPLPPVQPAPVSPLAPGGGSVVGPLSVSGGGPVQQPLTVAQPLPGSAPSLAQLVEVAATAPAPVAPTPAPAPAPSPYFTEKIGGSYGVFKRLSEKGSQSEGIDVFESREEADSLVKKLSAAAAPKQDAPTSQPAPGRPPTVTPAAAATVAAVVPTIVRQIGLPQQIAQSITVGLQPVARQMEAADQDRDRVAAEVGPGAPVPTVVSLANAPVAAPRAELVNTLATSKPAQTGVSQISGPVEPPLGGVPAATATPSMLDRDSGPSPVPAGTPPDFGVSAAGAEAADGIEVEGDRSPAVPGWATSPLPTTKLVPMSMSGEVEAPATEPVIRARPVSDLLERPGRSLSEVAAPAAEPLPVATPVIEPPRAVPVDEPSALPLVAATGAVEPALAAVGAEPVTTPAGSGESVTLGLGPIRTLLDEAKAVAGDGGGGGDDGDDGKVRAPLDDVRDSGIDTKRFSDGDDGDDGDDGEPGRTGARGGDGASLLGGWTLPLPVPVDIVRSIPLTMLGAVTGPVGTGAVGGAGVTGPVAAGAKSAGIDATMIDALGRGALADVEEAAGVNLPLVRPIEDEVADAIRSEKADRAYRREFEDERARQDPDFTKQLAKRREQEEGQEQRDETADRAEGFYQTGAQLGTFGLNRMSKAFNQGGEATMAAGSLFGLDPDSSEGIGAVVTGLTYLNDVVKDTTVQLGRLGGAAASFSADAFVSEVGRFAAQIPIVGGLLGSFGDAVGNLIGGMDRAVDSLETWSPSLMVARAQIEVSRITRDIERAGRMGPQLSEYAIQRESQRQRLEDALESLSLALVPLAERIVTGVEYVVPVVDGIGTVIGSIYEAIRILIQTLTAGTVDIGALTTTAEAALARIEENLRRVEANTRRQEEGVADNLWRAAFNETSDTRFIRPTPVAPGGSLNAPAFNP